MPPATAASFKTFILVWFGQVISLLGSGLTRFALGVWVFRETGSVTYFALIALFGFLPGILMSPIAGVLVDRWSRRKTMMLSDLGSGCLTLVVAALLWSGNLAVWHIYILVGAAAIFESFQWPAYFAAMSLLVPERHLGRANGMVQLGQSAAEIAAPLMAGFLVLAIGLEGIILIDCATFLFAVSTLSMVRFAEPPRDAAPKASSSIWAEAAVGWHYIRARHGLLALLLLFTALNFSNSFAIVLLTPMVLVFSNATMLGIILSVSGGGMLAGSLVLTAWGGPRKRIRGVLGFALLFGLGMCIQGAQPVVTVIAAGAFLASFSLPIINGSSQAIWQTQVDPGIQGRVFSVRRMVAWSSTPLGFVLAGPLSERVFEPLMREGGTLAPAFGPVIGAGPGRGMALLFISMGLLMFLTAVLGYLYKPLYGMEANSDTDTNTASAAANERPVNP